MHLITTWFGSFIVEEGKVVEQKLFPQDPKAIADRLSRIAEWEVLEEERSLLAGKMEVFVSELRLERAGGRYSKERMEFLQPETFGFPKELLHQAMLELGRRTMRKVVRPDDHLRQAIETLDDLQESSNLLLERLREWYGYHFPELSKLVPEEQFTRLIATYGDRFSMPGGLGESSGADLSEGERAQLMVLAATVHELRQHENRIQEYVERGVKELAPNLTRLCGPMIAARLVTAAGGLEELATLPASTVQLLGAERALFRHLKEGTRPPKHGILFQHPWLHKAQPWQRGSIARLLAGKIVIAARADFFTRRDISEQLKTDVEKGLSRIAERKPKPTSTKRWKARKRRGPRRGH